MKVIDLLNKIANGEKLPKKILIRDVVYYLINDEYGNIVYSQRMNKKDWEKFIDYRLNITRCLNEEVLTLDTGVEISEDNTIDIDNIEELLKIEEYEADKTDVVLNRNKINKVIQAVKQLNKKVNELESLNIEINGKDINEAINKAREQLNKEIKSIKEK